MQIGFIKCHGSGNDFPLIDARALALSEDEWAALARVMADRGGPVGGDGLLALVAGDADHAFGMRMFNSDGSEAETCLNGLRCTARLGFEALGIDRALVGLKTSSAEVAGADAIAEGVATIETRVGPVSTRTGDVGLRIDREEVIDEVVAALPSERRFSAVAMPNPHLVAFVDAIDEAELVALGEWCEAAPPVLPGRGNVSFVRVDGPNAIFVRTFERGVGLTDSCGSAMAASSLAAVLTGRIGGDDWITVRNRGGLVRAMVEQRGGERFVTIAGNATFEAEGVVEFDFERGSIASVEIVRRRDDEIAAWARVIAGAC